MNDHDLPAILSPDDRKRIERKLAGEPQSGDGPVTISVFLPGARQVILILAQDGVIISWC